MSLGRGAWISQRCHHETFHAPHPTPVHLFLQQNLPGTYCVLGTSLGKRITGVNTMDNSLDPRGLHSSRGSWATNNINDKMRSMVDGDRALERSQAGGRVAVLRQV